MHAMMCKATWKAARVLATSVAVFVLGGCAMKGDVRELQVEMRALAARQDSLLTELRRQTLSTQDTLRTQSNQMFDFRGDINRRLGNLEEGQRRLEALAGEIQRSLAGVRDQLANIRTLPGNIPRVTATDTASPATGGGERLVPGATDPDQLFQTAFQQLDRGSLRAAQAAFDEFLTQYPAHERAADARFYLADILEQQGRPEDALEAFQQIRTLHPAHDRVPDAMFRTARLQLELGDREAARATLETITNTYPNAPIAMLARDMLETIG